MRQIIRNKYMMLSTILLLTMVITWSYAFWGWTNPETTDVSVVVSNVSVIYKKGDDIVGATLKPTLTKEEGINKIIKVKLNGTTVLNPMIDFYLDIVSIDDELKENSFKYEILRNDSSIGSGSFFHAINGSTIKLTSASQPVTTTEDTYTLYIWIDGTVNNPLSMSDKSFNFKLRADGTHASYKETNEPNAPNLVEGMIPIKYNGSEWIKADISNTANDWYDYDNKKWANVVMVKETGTKTRADYMSDSVNTLITEDDILAYFVWIPRYKYQLFNVEFVKASEQEIQIEFEKGFSTTGTVSCSTSDLGVETCTNKENGNWYTHPAFTFGDEELKGIWVGKFEASVDTSSTCYTNPSAVNCNNTDHNIRIKPNVSSLRYQTISNQFLTSQKFNSTNYLTSTGAPKIDSHMIKNIEWGAIAYLTQSKYGRCDGRGICSEIFMNNSNDYYSGRSAGAPGGSVVTSKDFFGTGDTVLYSASGYYTYDDKRITCSVTCAWNTPINNYTISEIKEVGMGMGASTTGNIYGIYDMSGGAFEYTMGVMSDVSGNVIYSNSEFIYETFPEIKYYDKYKYGTTNRDQTAFNRSHLGDATGETRGWYGNEEYVPFTTVSWMDRGGQGSSEKSGTFYFVNGYGGAGYAHAIRVIISNK